MKDVVKVVVFTGREPGDCVQTFEAEGFVIDRVAPFLDDALRECAGDELRLVVTSVRNFTPAELAADELGDVADDTADELELRTMLRREWASGVFFGGLTVVFLVVGYVLLHFPLPLAREPK